MAVAATAQRLFPRRLLCDISTIHTPACLAGKVLSEARRKTIKTIQVQYFDKR